MGTGATTKFEHTDSSFYLTIPDVEMNSLANVFKLELE